MSRAIFACGTASAVSWRFYWIAQDARHNCLGAAIVRAVSNGWCPVEKMEELVRREPDKANAVTDIRERVRAEQARIGAWRRIGHESTGRARLRLDKPATTDCAESPR